jgi:hypothetical protein
MLKGISVVALFASIVPSLLFLLGFIDHNDVKWYALIATVIWFASTPIWMGQKESSSAASSSDATVRN